MSFETLSLILQTLQLIVALIAILVMINRRK